MEISLRSEWYYVKNTITHLVAMMEGEMDGVGTTDW